MTGIEAISNAVPAFKPPSWRNARATLSWMIFLLVAMFAGIVALARIDRLAPEHSQTILSQLAHRSVGSGVLYGFVQASTALVLLLAANTAFNGFPRLLYFMARNRHAPALFLRMGDRLAFSNGMLLLAVLAAALFAAFGGDTESLIPLYAVGVFLAFTLSQTGMVVLWLRTRAPGWRRSIGFNAVGAVLSAVVLVISGATKFTEGRMGRRRRGSAAGPLLPARPQLLREGACGRARHRRGARRRTSAGGSWFRAATQSRPSARRRAERRGRRRARARPSGAESRRAPPFRGRAGRGA